MRPIRNFSRVVCISALCSPTPADASFQGGIAAAEHGDYVTPLSELLPLARSGEAACKGASLPSLAREHIVSEGRALSSRDQSPVARHWKRIARLSPELVGSEAAGQTTCLVNEWAVALAPGRIASSSERNARARQIAAAGYAPDGERLHVTFQDWHNSEYEHAATSGHSITDAALATALAAARAEATRKFARRPSAMSLSGTRSSS